MKPRLLMWVSLIGLAATAMAVVMMVRSYRTSDVMIWGRFDAVPYHGRMMFSIGSAKLSRELTVRSEKNYDDDIVEDIAEDSSRFAGFGWSKIDFGPSGGVAHIYSFPLWFAAVIFASPSAVCLLRFVKGRKRSLGNLCPSCGYDLRGTPDRCPECGTAAGAA